jgi:hypothetical protein
VAYQNSDLDESISKRHAIAEIIGPGEVTVEGLRVELGEDVHLVDPAVYAVAHRHVDQPSRAESFSAAIRGVHTGIQSFIPTRCKNIISVPVLSKHDAIRTLANLDTQEIIQGIQNFKRKLRPKLVKKTVNSQ